MNCEYNKKIILEDGTEFFGYGFGADRELVAQIVFNTSMAGYQEILSDPSNAGLAMVMTYPLIGCCGMCDDDYESDKPALSAMIVRDYNDVPSNFRAAMTLEQAMLKRDIVGLTGVDTRRLVRHLRDNGTCKALIADAALPNAEGVSKLKAAQLPGDAVAQVSCTEAWKSPAENARFHVVAVDCGMKRSTLRGLNAVGCDVTVVPWNTTAEAVEALQPDGVFLSDGPGDPADVQPVIELVRALRGKYPLAGICLGHEIIALSYGARVEPLKFGHRGSNHPVREGGRVEIVSQNHGYVVDAESLEGTGLSVTHTNVLDGTVEGIKCEKDGVVSVQFHPECTPGSLFDQFVQWMEEKRNAEEN